MMKFCLAVMAALFLTAPAFAQFAFNGELPLSITSEEAEYEGGKTVLTKNVIVTQGETKIMSDEMTIIRGAAAGAAAATDSEDVDGFTSFGDIERIDAVGNFQYVTPDSVVTGERGVYMRGVSQITVTGNVAMRQGSGNVVRGERLIYDLETKRAQIGNQCVGDNCQSGSGVTFTIKTDE